VWKEFATEEEKSSSHQNVKKLFPGYKKIVGLASSILLSSPQEPTSDRYLANLIFCFLKT
jgi:hypothetical protein